MAFDSRVRTDAFAAGFVLGLAVLVSVAAPFASAQYSTVTYYNSDSCDANYVTKVESYAANTCVAFSASTSARYNCPNGTIEYFQVNDCSGSPLSTVVQNSACVSSGLGSLRYECSAQANPTGGSVLATSSTYKDVATCSSDGEKLLTTYYYGGCSFAAGSSSGGRSHVCNGASFEKLQCPSSSCDSCGVRARLSSTYSGDALRCMPLTFRNSF